MFLMSKVNKNKKGKNNKVKKWTEEQYEEYLSGVYEMEYIVGFTENGVPYGVLKKDLDKCGRNNFNDEMPF
ncbi:MAG: hypothetical protein ACRCW0_08305 [Clostridium sp.]